jgi:hypothetical protein
MARSIESLRDAAVHALLFRESDLEFAVETFFAAAGKRPYGGGSGRREKYELEVLQYAMPTARKKTGPLARQIWARLVAEWSAHAPKAGQQQWHVLASVHRKLGAKIPAKLRGPVRRAWAMGRLCNIKGESAFDAYSKAKTPEATLDALRAIADAAAVRKHFEFWECICAALVLLDEPDAKLAKTCLAKWKATEGENAEPSIYEV